MENTRGHRKSWAIRFRKQNHPGTAGMNVAVTW